MDDGYTKGRKRKKTKTKRTETGKCFYDLSKATFSITVLGDVALAIKDNYFTDSLIYGMATGLLMSSFLFFIGYKILDR